MGSNFVDYTKVSSGRRDGRLSYLEVDKTSIMNLWDRIRKAEKYFTKKEYAVIVERAVYLFQTHQDKLCEEELNKLPSSAQLLQQLVEKLKGKSVAKTLRKIQEGKLENDLLTAKGLSSLLTHVVIECEHGNNEYKVLIPNIIEKLNEVIYNALQ